MKKFPLFYVFIFIVFLIGACTKTTVIKFNMKANDVIFTLDTSSLIGERTMISQNLIYNLDSALSANSLDKSAMTYINVKETYIDLISGVSTLDDFNYIKSMLQTDSKPLTELAMIDPMPKDGVRSIPLDVNGTFDFRSYLDGAVPKLIIRGYFNTPITQEAKVRCRITFEIHGEL